MTKVYPNKAGLQGTTETSHLVRPGTVKITELISTVTDIPVFTHKSSTSLFTNTADTFITTKPPSRATSFPKPQLFTTVAELLTRFSNKSITLGDMAIKSGKILDEHVNICGTNVWLVISVILLVFVAAQTCYIFRPSQPSTQLLRFLQLFRNKQPPKPEVQRANTVDLIRLEPISKLELPVEPREDHSTPIRKHIVLRSSDLPPTPVLPVAPTSPQFVDIVECCSNGNGFGLENASTLSDDYVDFLGHHPFLLSAITTILFELHKNKAQSQTDFRTRGSVFSQVMADAVSRLQAIYILDKQGLVDLPFGRLASEADIVAFFRRAERNGLVDSGLLLPKKKIKIVDVTTVQISDSVED